MSTTGTDSGMFNPHQVRVLQFRQDALPRAEGTPQAFRYEVTIGLGEAETAGLRVSSLTLTAEGFSIEKLPQIEMIDLMLDTVIEALARERAGIRPGSPTPAAPALPALPARRTTP